MNTIERQLQLYLHKIKKWAKSWIYGKSEFDLNMGLRHIGTRGPFQ